MAALVSALDNFTPSQLGENGSTEYTWSNSIRERIIQLSFQLTRTRDQTTILDLSNKTDQLLTDLKRISISNREEYIEYMSLLYRLIAHTRDIVDGKGEYPLSYMLLGVWDRHHPELAQFALRQFVIPSEPESHPYGSWKDIKYLHKYDESSQLVRYGIDLMVHQLRLDAVNNNPSLAAKWVPREKSQFKELFTILATNYFQEYILTAKTDPADPPPIIT